MSRKIKQTKPLANFECNKISLSKSLYEFQFYLVALGPRAKFAKLQIQSDMYPIAMFQDAVQLVRLPNFPRAFQSYKRRPEPPVAGAVLRFSSEEGSQYLLVRGRHSGKWSFPKGHKEDFETLHETIQREVQEEVGINTLPPYVSEFQGRVGTYRVFDLPEPIRPCPQDLDEVDAADWFSLKEILTMTLNVDTSYYFLKTYNLRTSPSLLGRTQLPTDIPDGVALTSRYVSASL